MTEVEIKSDSKSMAEIVLGLFDLDCCFFEPREVTAEFHGGLIRMAVTSDANLERS